MLTATGGVVANTRSRLNITIRDVGDGLYDSVVFVESGSFATIPGGVARRAESLSIAAVPDVSSMYTDTANPRPALAPAVAVANTVANRAESETGPGGYVAIGAGAMLVALLLVVVAVGAWILARTSLPAAQVKCTMCDAPKRFECEVPLVFKGFKIKLTQEIAEGYGKDFAGYCPDCGAGVSSIRLTEISKHFASAGAGKFTPMHEVLMGEDAGV